MMFGMENKAVQCELIASNCSNGVSQILQRNGSSKDDIITQAVRHYSTVHCSGPPFAQDNEEVDETKQGQNEQTVSNDGSQSNGSVGDEQQPSTSIADGCKSSLSGDREVYFAFKLIISVIKILFSLVYILKRCKQEIFC